MKKLFKTLLVAGVAVMILAALCFSTFSSSAQSGDPADSYVVQKAPYEDSSVSLWFEHSFNKVFTSDKTPSGMNTYSAYMAKNEVENIQFVLYSDSTKANMGATVTSFTDVNGNEIPAEIYYEMYVTVSDIREEFVNGATASTTPIREGETPDPVYPLSRIGGKFQLNAGKSQAFFVKIKTAEDTPSGWYSAQLNITNSSGQVVKTATIFCYVWDFALSEETAFKTALFTDNDTTYGGTYQKFYDYLLENRLVSMDPPGGITSDNPYLTNPRVNAVRVTYAGGGSQGSYGEVGTDVEYYRYLDIYNDLSLSEDWDSIKDKLYFYTADEPVGAVWNKLTGSENMTVDDVKTFYGHLSKYWDDPQTTVPYHENHPYPYFTYTRSLTGYKDYQLTDSTQAMIDQGGITMWCPQIYAFTPQSELTAAGYKGMGAEPVRDLSATISGLYSWGSDNSSNGVVGSTLLWGTEYYNWNNLYGEFSDRIKSEMYMAEKNGESANSTLWTYGAGGNYCYTYANHLIENTGLQTKIFFWQCYQNDITGYLYYSTNGWSENDLMNGTVTVDNTPTGSNTMCQWKTNKLIYNQDTFYGNGVLFYGANQARMRGISDYVGTLRVELMRDGIEEYQMLKMLEEYKGETAAKAVVSKISANIVRYLSLPGFDRSAFSSSMDEYDIMENVRRDLGNTLEAAIDAGACEHTYDSGTETKSAGCLTAGTRLYTCTKCSASYSEVIPALHTEGSCFSKVSGDAATCTADGSEIYQCGKCGYKKTVTTTAFHNDIEYYRYEKYNENNHYVYCTVCDEKITAEAHIMFEKDSATCLGPGEIIEYCRYCSETASTGISTPTKEHELVSVTAPATCTEDGYTGVECTVCGYREVTVIPATDHTYVNGTCTACGEKEPAVEPDYTPGDLTGDGTINAMDVNIAKRILSGAVTPSAAQNLAGDINGDGQFNGKDANYLARIASGAIG